MKTKLEGTVTREKMVDQIRLAARQFAMLYFHFVKTLVDEYGKEKAHELVQKTIFEQAVDRSDKLREKRLAKGAGTDTVEDFMEDIDLPFCGWIPEWGKDHCPYAEIWREYIRDNEWFKEFALFYCDVIDTTTIENFTKKLSHRITQNVITEGTSCKREYFASEAVERGEYTYGRKG